MSDEDVTAKIAKAVRSITHYIDAQVLVISDAHGHLSSYNEGRVDAFNAVSELCDRLLRPTVTSQPDATGQP